MSLNSLLLLSPPILGRVCGNEPVCVWRYGIDDLNVFTDSDEDRDARWTPDFAAPLPDKWIIEKYSNDSRMDKYCIVLRTHGEKRLASHLLPGVEMLIPLFTPDSLISPELETTMNTKCANRVDPATHRVGKVTWQIREPGELLDLVATRGLLRERVPAPSTPAPDDLPRAFLPLWQDACASLNTAMVLLLSLFFFFFVFFP